MASGVLGIMEKPIQIQQQQQHISHEALKCPRCDSSNTKFCYYNNYSLSQPRHFCKACKRYWTRGGTLRNVPVGGGCRKNKRVKRPITPGHVHHVATIPSPANPQRNPNTDTNLDQNPMMPSSTATNSNSNHHFSPLFYGLLPQNPNYPRFDTARVSNETSVSGYDLLRPHTINTSGLVFSSSVAGGSLMASHSHNQNLTFSSYNNSSSMYGSGSTSSSTSAPTIASLLASSLDQQQRFTGYDGGSLVKDLKMEETQNMMEWNTNNFKNDQIELAVVSSDPNSIFWDTEGSSGGWIDPTNNIGSSVPSLI